MGGPLFAPGCGGALGVGVQLVISLSTCKSRLWLVHLVTVEHKGSFQGLVELMLQKNLKDWFSIMISNLQPIIQAGPGEYTPALANTTSFVNLPEAFLFGPEMATFVPPAVISAMFGSRLSSVSFAELSSKEKNTALSPVPDILSSLAFKVGGGVLSYVSEQFHVPPAVVYKPAKFLVVMDYPKHRKRKSTILIPHLTKISDRRPKNRLVPTKPLNIRLYRGYWVGVGAQPKNAHRPW